MHERTRQRQREDVPRRASYRDEPDASTIPLITALRPQQWTKNLLVFAAVLFSIRFTQSSVWIAGISAFGTFCLFSSAGYLINDLLDFQADRRHPIKRNRPIASGAISRATAIIMTVSLIILGSVLSLRLSLAFTAVALAYLVVSISYSLVLKHYVLIDLFAIATGFILRAAAGAIAIGVPISPWLYVCTGLAALFLALGKRRHELLILDNSAGQHRRNLDDYTIELVDQLTLVVTSAAVISYSLYTISAEGRPANPAMMLTIPFVLYSLFRYLYLVHIRKLGGSPEELLLRDRPLGLAVASWVAACAIILYTGPR